MRRGQQRGTPVFHAGAFYYPSGPSTFFDGNVMQRTGTFEGVPLYEDATQTPFTVVYVPIGGNVVRPYERRREGELAGSTGSRTPSFPVQTDGEVSVGAAPAWHHRNHLAGSSVRGGRDSRGATAGRDITDVLPVRATASDCVAGPPARDGPPGSARQRAGGPAGLDPVRRRPVGQRGIGRGVFAGSLCPGRRDRGIPGVPRQERAPPTRSTSRRWRVARSLRSRSR